MKSARNLIKDIGLILASSIAMAGQAAAADAGGELEALRAQVEAMSARLKQLEASGQSAVPGTPTVAVASPADVKPPAPGSAAPANRFTFAGDVRVRAESIDEEGFDRRERDRVRSRAGVTAQLTPSVVAGARLATGGREPRGTNATLTGEGAKKDVGVDLAYVRWSMSDNLTMTAGKMEDRTWHPKYSLMTSADHFPEGWAAAYGGASGFFASLSRHWLEERAADSDSVMHGAQLGYRFVLPGKDRLTLAAGYSDFREVQARKPFYDGVSSYGNTLLADGTLANDFNVVQVGAQYETNFYVVPFALFLEAAHNLEAQDYDMAATAGVSLGDSSQARGWQVTYQYELMEKDAMFAQFINADVGGGNTDFKGHIVRFGYGLAKNWSVNLLLMLNDVNMDVGQQHGYTRAQLDLLAKF